MEDLSRPFIESSTMEARKCCMSIIKYLEVLDLEVNMFKR